ncbi:hypothetical protein ACFVVX_32535 [Kitasatospora sp. NPDC058170]|uniref:hypothetical protein n=1 Tax=Kitasatospora sp. NPDC058170 TaxID=3346364 RepID=UPI0036D861D6
MFATAKSTKSTKNTKNTKSTKKLTKPVGRTLCSLVLAAVPLLLLSTAQPAAAEGPRTPEEAAVCRGVLNALVGGSLFGGQSGAVCAVRPDGGDASGR